MTTSATTKDVSPSMSAALQYYSQKGFGSRGGGSVSSDKLIDDHSLQKRCTSTYKSKSFSDNNIISNDDSLFESSLLSASSDEGSSSTSLSTDLSWPSQLAIQKPIRFDLRQDSVGQSFYPAVSNKKLQGKVPTEGEGYSGSNASQYSDSRSDSATEITEKSSSLSYNDLHQQAESFLKEISSTSDRDRVVYCDDQLNNSTHSSADSKSTVSILRRSIHSETSQDSDCFRRSWGSAKTVTFCLDEDNPETVRVNHSSLDVDLAKSSSEPSRKSCEFRTTSTHASAPGSIKIRLLRRSSMSTTNDPLLPDHDGDLEPSSSGDEECPVSRRWSFSPADTQQLSNHGMVLEPPSHIRPIPDRDDCLDPESPNDCPIKIRISRSRSLNTEGEKLEPTLAPDQLNISSHSCPHFRRLSSPPSLGRNQTMSLSTTVHSGRNSDSAEWLCSPSTTLSSSVIKTADSSHQLDQNNCARRSVHAEGSSPSQQSHCDKTPRKQNNVEEDGVREGDQLPVLSCRQYNGKHTAQKQSPHIPPPPKSRPKSKTQSIKKDHQNVSSSLHSAARISTSTDSQKGASSDCESPLIKHDKMLLSCSRFNSSNRNNSSTPNRRRFSTNEIFENQPSSDAPSQRSKSKTPVRRRKTAGDSCESEEPTVASSPNICEMPSSHSRLEFAATVKDSINGTMRKSSSHQCVCSLDQTGSNLDTVSTADCTADRSSREIFSSWHLHSTRPDTRSNSRRSSEETSFSEILARAMVIRKDDEFQALESQIGKSEFEKQLKRAVCQVFQEMCIEKNSHISTRSTAQLPSGSSVDVKMPLDSNPTEKNETTQEQKPDHTCCRPSSRRRSEQISEDRQVENQKNLKSGKRSVPRRRSDSFFPRQYKRE